MAKQEKRTARIVGALFLIAMAASLIGAGLIEPILNVSGYLADTSAIRSQVVSGVILELINGIAVIGIAVMLFPLFKRYDEALALGYVAFRIIEAVIIFAAVISPLTLLSLSEGFVSAGAVEGSYFQTVGASVVAMRTHLYEQMLGIFFSLAALLLFYLLYQTRLVPRWISVWGLIAVVSVFAWNLLELFGIHVSFGLILALPIILNEIFLAIWLIVKGFNPPETISEPAQAAVA